jgi:hypothetical protein
MALGLLISALVSTIPIFKRRITLGRYPREPERTAASY